MAWLGRSAGSGSRGVVPRRQPRYQTHGLTCALGDVIDLSATGMRVSCRRKPAVRRGDVLDFSIRAGSQRISLLGRVAWTRRASWRAHRIGVEFLSIRPGVAEALVELALHGFVAGRTGGVNFTMGADGPTPTRGRRVRASVEVEDLYRLLGVPRNADEQAIRAAYRHSARVFHPDVSTDPDAEKKFAQISKAYSVLGDAEKRRRYDELLRQAAA